MVNGIIRLTDAICDDYIENLLDGSHWVLVGMAYPVSLSWFCVKNQVQKIIKTFLCMKEQVQQGSILLLATLCF